MVPKPYFTLEEGGLTLHNSPVPRPSPVEDVAHAFTLHGAGDIAGWRGRALRWFQETAGLDKVRRFVREDLANVKSAVYRWSGLQPYPDFKDETTSGWTLMKAILQQFVREAAPVPVLIVPIPTYHFYSHGVKPIYQPFFEALAGRGVHVLDVSNPLIAHPWEVRQTFSFKSGGHFTPFAHDLVARMMAETIEKERLLPQVNVASKNSAPILRRSPDPRHILGISCLYHNSAAAIVRDGEIVAAAEEERFTRIKNDRRIPYQAMNYCLEEAGIDPKDLAAVVYYDNSALTFDRILHTQLGLGDAGEETWMRVMPSWLRFKLRLPQILRKFLKYDGPVLQEIHHRSHAASAFYPSPFEKAAILTIDGVGEWATASIGRGNGNQVELLREMRFPHSLGLLYSAFTQFTGFKVNSGEYKMMGLAPYGEPKYAQTILDHLVDLKEDGSLELNMEYFGFLNTASMFNEKFAALFGGPARKPDSRITRREMDLARSIQLVTEEAMLRMARHAHQLTGEAKLCLAGGVALNCVANGRLLREGPFEDLWIQPAAGDAGCALGAALDAYHTHFGKPRNWHAGARPLQRGSYWGPSYSEDEIEAYLDTHGYPYRKMTGAERPAFLAQCLAEGKVVGHFSGRLEFGPRSLGARSILGDARNPEMQVGLNLKVKYRESFRPFAPSVIAERVQDYFELDRESPFMLIVAPVREERRKPLQPMDGEDMLPYVRQARSDLPAITHVDYSARIQTVTRDDHPAYYEVLEAFEKLTGCGVIVNTSFNVRGEPIICSPHDAYRCFMRTGMNVLAMGDYILLKEEQPPWPEGTAEGLESEDAAKVEQNPHPEVFLRKLRQIYHEMFLPATREIRERRAHSGFSTLWGALAPATSGEIFAMPAAMDQMKFEANEFAAALVSPDLAPLRPAIARALEIGLEYAPGEDLEETVSESMYVMF
jgi:carbamoyltransferase